MIWWFIAALAGAAYAVHHLLRRTRREAKDSLRERARLRVMVHDNFEMIGLLSNDGLIQFQNPAVNEVLGYTPQQLTGSSFVELVHPADVASFRRLLHHSSATPRQAIQGAFRAKHSDGSWRHFEASLTNHIAEPGVDGIVANLKDISERFELQEKLSRQAFVDGLTQLPNRALFQDRLSHALRRASRRTTAVGVLLLDLDTFKVVNESLGPNLADRLLIEVSERLRQGLRPEDTLARLGGDEFAVLLEDIARPQDAAFVAERIGKDLHAPFTIAGREVFVTASVGIAVDGGDGQAEDVLRNADLAMYDAKQRGRARHAFFDPAMTSRASERFDVESDLRRGIPGELAVHYQPVIDLANGRILECEALVRWEHPRRGLVTPGQFIRVAEETDLIHTLGRFVLEESCRQLAIWRAAYPAAAELVMSVNISPKQLGSDGLVDMLREILERAALPPSALKLEVTESVALTGAEQAIARLQALRNLGVRIAIDDFGTGYSALTYLKRFPIDTIKVDRSFVSGLGRDPQDKAIVGAVLAFARALGLDVTAEGIETHEQLRELKEFNCHRGQGYFFARPLTAGDFEALLRSGSELARVITASTASLTAIRAAV